MEIGDYNFDDDLIAQTAGDRHPRVVVYRIEGRAVVLGRGSRPEDELEAESIVSDGIPVYRRRGGGCAVVLDEGNVIVSVVLPAMGFGKIREYFELLSEWLICALGDVGIREVRREGISDLALDGKKIAGASMQRKPDYVYYTSSILFDPDTALMEKYLRHPPREPGYRRRRSHAEFAGSLINEGEFADIESFMEGLRSGLNMERLMEMDVRRHSLILNALWKDNRGRVENE